MAFCMANCLMLNCDRNQKHLQKGGKDYASFKRTGLGASMADFSKSCDLYKPDVKSNGHE